MRRESAPRKIVQKRAVNVQKSVEHLAIITKQDEYETPPAKFRYWCQEYNVKLLLDVCGTKKQADRLGLPFNLSKRDNALKCKWDMPFFMNPPYSQVAEWMRYAYLQALEHHVDGMILTYAKTDTKWWHDYVERNRKAEVHFIKGRIRFNYNGKPTSNSAPYPSVVIIFRKDKKRRGYPITICPNCRYRWQ